MSDFKLHSIFDATETLTGENSKSVTDAVNTLLRFHDTCSRYGLLSMFESFSELRKIFINLGLVGDFFLNSNTSELQVRGSISFSQDEHMVVQDRFYSLVTACEQWAKSASATIHLENEIKATSEYRSCQRITLGDSQEKLPKLVVQMPSADTEMYYCFKFSPKTTA